MAQGGDVLNEPIHRQLRTIRLAIPLTQHETADLIGVSQLSISAWDRGYRTPSAAHAITYAHTLQHRLIVTRGGQTIGDLADLLPRLHELREQAGLSQRTMSYLAYMGKTTVHDVESQARAGKGRLSSLAWYLGVLAYQLELASAAALERAA